MKQIIKTPLEDKVTLLHHIGRDQEQRGKSGFNIQVELLPGKRFDAFMFLEQKGYIEVYNKKEISDMDGTATFVDCRLTNPKGRAAYEWIEKAYAQFIESIKLKE